MAVSAALIVWFTIKRVGPTIRGLVEPVRPATTVAIRGVVVVRLFFVLRFTSTTFRTDNPVLAT